MSIPQRASDLETLLSTTVTNQYTCKPLQTSTGTVKPNAVVSKDGRGNYTIITEAMKVAIEKSDIRYVIHVKSGVYAENVELHIFITKHLKIPGRCICKCEYRQALCTPQQPH